ncbi:hypothetical protein ACN47E_002354 [Coniothyrium glycines]
MYRRSDPRWNRTIQHITENIEHANESAQENIYGFAQRYVTPCLSSVSDCVSTCAGPCIPTHNDRRRHRGRSRGRAELSFDFYDDWEENESDGLLGWGSDNLDRFLGGSSHYGTTTQPGRQPAMSYGQRSRDTRYNTPRQKSLALPRDGAQDPTIIPSSSYFGFLGRLPFNVGGKALRYKPSAADLTERPGGTRRNTQEEQPLIEDSEEDVQHENEHKGHRRHRSDTQTSGHTTDSLSSRGDIFPSEDELEDAVPLDDEFTISLERRTAGQWNEDSSSVQARSDPSKKPSGSHMSTRTGSSKKIPILVLKSSEEEVLQHSTTHCITENAKVDNLQRQEENDLGVEEEATIKRKRQEAQCVAVRCGLLSEQLPTPIPRSPSPEARSQVSTVRSVVPRTMKSSLVGKTSHLETTTFSASDLVHTSVEERNMYTEFGNGSFVSSSHILPHNGTAHVHTGVAGFVPARLPHFDSSQGERSD